MPDSTSSGLFPDPTPPAPPVATPMAPDSGNFGCEKVIFMR